MHAAIVDPSRVVLKMISQLLAERGDTSSEFVDSHSALNCIKSDPTIDLLITSLEVQPISGLELCWEARLAVAASRPLYIIVMSSLSDEQKLAEALDSGADDLITKPVRRIELHAKVRMAGRLRANQLHLMLLAETDPLTGLLNRRAFFNKFNRILQKGTAPLAAVMFDIDHFKRVNDTYGHDMGDAVIKRVASEAAGMPGLVGRLGGEEFAMILEGYDEDRAYELADRLRQKCAQIDFLGTRQPFSVTCSFGVSCWNQGEAEDDLLKRSDIALYRAKEEGRNRVAVANS